MVVMKIASDTQVRKGDFIRTKHFAGAADRVILGMVEVVVIGNVDANLRGEELRIEGRFFRPRIAIQPGPVRERERLGFSWLVLRRRWLVSASLRSFSRGGRSTQEFPRFCRKLLSRIHSQRCRTGGLLSQLTLQLLDPITHPL